MPPGADSRCEYEFEYAGLPVISLNHGDRAESLVAAASVVPSDVRRPSAREQRYCADFSRTEWAPAAQQIIAADGTAR